jgi:predicted RNase H-like nuclease (RuvC/YqgF family)
LRDLEKEYKVVNKEINKNNRAIRKWENFIIWYTNGIRETNQEIVRLQNAVDGWNTGFSIFGVTIVDNEAKIERLKERTAEYETELENLKQKNIETARTNQILSWGFGTVENAINDISTAKTISEFNDIKKNAIEGNHDQQKKQIR